MRYPYPESSNDVRLIELSWAQRGLCALCGQWIDLSLQYGPGQATIDHIIPRSKGGGHHAANLQMAHRGCNSRKGNRDA
jgi:5-methylcytosine-specific restriction endonuclease McrA